MNRKSWAQLIGLSVLWGISFFFVELANPVFPPFTMVLARVGVAALLTAWLIRGVRWRAFFAGRWRTYAFLGLFNSAFPFFCFAWGQHYMDSGVASILNSLVPIFVYALALCAGQEAFKLMRVSGIFLSFFGVVILINPQQEGVMIYGILAGTAASVSYAAGIFVAGRRLSAYPPTENAFGQVFFASLWVLPLALWEQPWTLQVTPTALSALAGLAVLSTFFAYLLYYRLLSGVGAINTSMVVLLIPLVAVSLGIALLNEPISGNFIAGGLLILSGLLCTDDKLRFALRTLNSKQNQEQGRSANS